MENLKLEIKDMKREINELYSIVSKLQLEIFDLASKLRSLEDFWYEN